MTHTQPHTQKNQGQKSVVPKDRVKTDGHDQLHYLRQDTVYGRFKKSMKVRLGSGLVGHGALGLIISSFLEVELLTY